jgi:hypothetical protein
MRRRPLWCSVLALGTLACGAGWHRPAELSPGPWKPRQQAQVWTGGGTLRWHGIVVETDSISGVWFRQAPDCDSCRVRIALQRVDSVRVGNPMAGFWKTFGLIMAVPFVANIIICRSLDFRGCFPET